MGKGARNREKNAEETQIKKQEAIKDVKKKSRNKIIAFCLAGVVVVGVAAGLLVNQFYFSNGTYLRSQTVATSKTETVDNSMMLYFFNQTLNSYRSYYGDYFEAFTGVDLTKSLKKQDYSTDQSWFQFLIGQSKEALTELMALCDAADAAGFKLTETEKQAINDRADKVDLSGFNNLLNREDYKKCLQLTALATMYKNSLLNGYSFSDEDIGNYYDANSKTFQTVDFRRYSVSYSEEEGSELPTKEEAEIMALKLKSVKTEEEFVNAVSELVKTDDPEITEEDLQKKLDATKNENQTYQEGSEISEWLFDASRKIGDIYEYTTDTTTSFTVYFLTSLPARDETATVDMRHILFTAADYGSEEEAKAKAEEVLAQLEGTDRSAQTWEEYALKYTSDGGSTYTGGLYTNITEGSMVAEINDWLFDSARKQGDMEIVKTTYGYHIVSFEGAGKAVWQAKVDTTLRENAYSDAVKSLKEEYPVSINDEKINDIPA